jgi:hypothetical protein
MNNYKMSLSFVFCRLQEKNVKEKQVQHWKAVIALQERLQTNQHRVSVSISVVQDSGVLSSILVFV